MYGSQVAWSQAFGGVPVYVARKDLGKATQAMAALLERDSRTDDEARLLGR